jgi:biotin carboxyl carrier protein
MAKSSRTSPSGTKPTRNRKERNASQPGSGPPEGTLPGGKASGAGKLLNLPEENGNGGNGKVRYKSLIIDGTKYRTHLNTKFEKRRFWQSPDSRKITSSIPGTVIKVYVGEGQEVRAGDQMLTLEAMKMKNKILFDTGGTVKSIHVSEGEKIPKDFLMLEME